MTYCLRGKIEVNEKYLSLEIIFAGRGKVKAGLSLSRRFLIIREFSTMNGMVLWLHVPMAELMLYFPGAFMVL